VPTSGRGAALSLGLPGRDPLLLQAGASVAIVGPPGALAGVAATLAGHGGAVALACDGRSLTPGDTDAWHARVATVGHRDALLGPTLRDDLDGDGRHGSFAMVAWLHACGAGSLATRLEQPSGGLWSGGERRRICLARALAARPGLLVLEDPSAPLDPVAAAALLRVLSHPRRRCTIVVLGCDAAVAAACQRVVVLADQPDEGTAAEILARPQHHRWLREEAA